MDRAEVTLGFYSMLEELEAQIGGSRRVGSATGRMNWPERGRALLRGVRRVSGCVGGACDRVENLR